MSSPVRPLVPTAPLSEFGELHDTAEFNDPHRMDRDQSYVPGFSEMRRNREINVAEYQAGKIPASGVPTLPVNMRWARNQNKAGTPDNTKPYSHGRKGYRVVTKDDAGQPWLTEIPPGALIGPDGSIRNGDCVLMVADAQSAARNERAKRQLTNERLEGVNASFSQHAAQAGANPAAAPYSELSAPTPASGAKPGRK